MASSSAQVRLPIWPTSSSAAWTQLTDRAANLYLRVGENADHAQTIERVRRLIDEGAWDALRQGVAERIFARALISVWADDEDRARASLVPSLLRPLTEAHCGPHASRLLTLNLLGIFTRYFDDLLESETFDLLRQAIFISLKALTLNGSAGHSSLLRNAFNYSDLFLSLRGPGKIAQEAHTQGHSATTWFQHHGMLGYDTGRFGLRVRQAIYIEQIKQADPYQSTGLEFLAEVTTDDVLQAPGGNEAWFGHEVIAALTSRPAGTPCQQWVDTVLEIAGDPRIRHTPQWRIWWQHVPDSVIATVLRWLSHTDLETFLTAFSQWASETDQDDISRMFAGRDTFLRGLFNCDLIKETRLILGRDAQHAVQAHSPHALRGVDTYNGQPQTAIIVVDCGDFQVVEGSHNFKMRLYAGGPLPICSNRRKREFERSDVIQKTEAAHQSLTGLDDHGREEIVHKGLWQRTAVTFIVEKIGISVNIEQLMGPTEYRKMWTRHGLPIPGRQQLRWTK